MASHVVNYPALGLNSGLCGMAKGLLRSTSTVSSMTLLSRLMGLVRDVTIAHLFGAGAVMDAFWVAFRVPNFMRRLFAEGAFTQSFVPVLSKYQQQESAATTREFVANMLGILGLILTLLTIVVELAAPVVILVFAPGFADDPERLAQATQMFYLTFPYLMLISLTAFCGAILNSYGSFAIPAFTPVFLNLSLISAAYFIAPHLSSPVHSLAWGVLLAGFIQLIFQLPFLAKIKFLVWPKLNFAFPGVRQVLKLIVPALFGVSVMQISLLLDTVFASFLPAGSVSWLYYADRLTSFPLGVFATAIATVILPFLSRKHATNSHSDYAATLDWALRIVLLIGIPAAIGLLLLAGPLQVTLFHSAAFTKHDVLMSRSSMMAFALGLPSFMLIKVLAGGFYAKQEIKIPVRCAAAAVVANVILNLILIYPLQHVGLALATSLSALLNASLLFLSLKQRKIFIASPNWGKYLVQLILANVAMAVVVYYFAGSLAVWFEFSTIQRVLHIITIVGTAMLVYFAVLYLLGLRWQAINSQSLLDEIKL
jgi:putative peptidoglycan lipid II flippase